MNLMHFLTVGQSFSGAKSEPSPYRLPRQNWLPKFTPPDPLSPATDKINTAVASSKATRQAKPSPTLDPVPLEAMPKVGAPAATMTKEPKPARSGFPLFRSSAKPTVRLRQAELSLDTVTVVHNDLRDTDYEVVPKRPAPPVAAASVRRYNPPPSASSSSAAVLLGLNGLAKRLLQAGRRLF